MILKEFRAEESLTKQRILFEECFPETVGKVKSTEGHYYWKFHSKPGPVQSVEYEAVIDDELVGYYAAIPYEYSSSVGNQTIAMVCDVMTGVAARGKGVFTKLGIHSTNAMGIHGYDIALGYPIRPEVIPGHIKAGWQIMFDLPLFGRFLRFDTFLSQKKLSFLSPLAYAVEYLATTFRSSFLYASKSQVTFHECTDDILQQLSEYYEKAGKRYNFSLVKNADFLKWRLRAPEQTYTICIAKNNHQIVGCAVLKKFDREGMSCVGILDLEMEPGALMPKNMVYEITRWARKSGADLILTMISASLSTKYRLLRDFFIRTPFSFKLIAKPLSSDKEAHLIIQEASSHLMWIDSDDL
jgi:hypothetical protein